MATTVCDVSSLKRAASVSTADVAVVKKPKTSAPVASVTAAQAGAAMASKTYQAYPVPSCMPAAPMWGAPYHPMMMAPAPYFMPPAAFVPPPFLAMQACMMMQMQQITLMQQQMQQQPGSCTYPTTSSMAMPCHTALPIHAAAQPVATPSPATAHTAAPDPQPCSVSQAAQPSTTSCAAQQPSDASDLSDVDFAAFIDSFVGKDSGKGTDHCTAASAVADCLNVEVLADLDFSFDSVATEFPELDDKVVDSLFGISAVEPLPLEDIVAANEAEEAAACRASEAASVASTEDDLVITIRAGHSKSESHMGLAELVPVPLAQACSAS
mmetsp:Transcript_16046/g.34685  ORF Transcript_16046/g.34685 Transcript_16046/m.34685 type:complete len:325 (-) Transcript_16046:2358-3332(-)|eukprot:CAMPEP_0202901170 /NCGR_PEP_ID=MMETSP1392-20130828/13731_1 /ASSEMBLY_ACC=CAM_ASM_000868 /TAXON_ID=225041 /ORGANISM="Chlamydomonas chlamydogama, Strain SAG 11-48b" /LENGTH=324 /DNA_ID=CAMNT_0049587683 /DNA_START=276 /DNA_END=1250 /DNA_ORIENTATION=+